jgi:hypothetical protein
MILPIDPIDMQYELRYHLEWLNKEYASEEYMIQLINPIVEITV